MPTTKVMEKNYVPLVPLSALLCVLLLIISVPSQAQTFVWGKNVGGSGNTQGMSIAVDAVGNSYVTGMFSGTASVDFNPSPTATASLTSLGQTDMFIAKYDPAGNYVWAKQISGDGPSDQAWGIAVDGNGAAYITGSFSGTADFNPDPATVYSLTGTGSTMFLAKYDSNGSLVWAVNSGAVSSGAVSFGRGVTLDGSNNILVTGGFNGTVTFGTSSPVTLTNTVQTSMFIARYSSSGELDWIQSVGGGSSVIGTDIGADAGGNVYVKGLFTGSVDFDPTIATQVLNSVDGRGFVTRYNQAGFINGSINCRV